MRLAARSEVIAGALAIAAIAAPAATAGASATTPQVARGPHQPLYVNPPTGYRSLALMQSQTMRRRPELHPNRYPQIQKPGVASRPAAAPAGTVPCPELQPDALCGQVEVPLDRSRPDSTKVPVGFVVLPRTDASQAPLAPVFVTFGGPGDAASANTFAALYDFAPAESRRDIVLVDYRGEGRSQAIDCSPLQHLTTNSMDELIVAVDACGAQLGDASDRYGAADVADDVDAVRAALGYRTINLDAISYGTVQAQAYALRHPEHLRALILDGAISPLDTSGSWELGISNAQAIANDVALICQRSPDCSSTNHDPAATFAGLVRRVRARPLDGTAEDVTGTDHIVHVDEAALIEIAAADDFFYTNDGELVAAGAALQRGDPLPLLRLAANNQAPLVSDSGDPGVFSFGVNAATQCTDFPVPWDLSAGFAERVAQFEGAIRRLPFGPFSADAWANDAGFSGYCLQWPAPRHLTPVFTPHAKFPAVPVLVIAATLDVQTTLAQNRFVAREFPHAQLVVLRNGGHAPGFFAGCIPDIYARFLDTLDAGDTSCLQNDDIDRPAVGTFPQLVAQATPATPLPGDQSTPRQRRLGTAVWATVKDALRQSFRLPDPSHGTGVGLRGGTFDETFDFDRNLQRLDLHELRFARDAAVNGQVTNDNGQLTARLAITSDGHHVGTLDLTGTWVTFGTPAGAIRLSGKIDDRPVALSAPAA